MEETESERRLRKVEEAVIEFQQIAKYVIGEHSSRIKGLEDDMSDIKTVLYDSCDLKTKEIDTKVKESGREMFKWITYLATAVIGVAGLGLTAVIHFNDHVSTVETNVATIKAIQENRNIQIATIITELSSISTFIHNHDIVNKEDK